MCFKKQPIKKNGVLYSSVKAQLRPFDAILFKGGATFSKIVKVLEEHGNKIPKSGEFTHVGMIVTSDIINHVNVIPGKVYILESIVGGMFAHGIPNIDGLKYSGVQLRDFDEVMTASDKINESIIAWGKLIHNPIDYVPLEEIKTRFSNFFSVYNGKMYDANVYSMLSAACSCMRPCRENVEEICSTEEWYFCSEIIAMVYKHMGIYPPTVNPKDVLPRDIAYPEADTDVMPKIINDIVYMTTPLHYQN